MATVKTYVHVHSEDGRQHAALQPGDTIPDWAVVTNPAVLGDESDAPAPAPADDEPAPAPADDEHEEPTPAKRAPRRRKAASPDE